MVYEVGFSALVVPGSLEEHPFCPSVRHLWILVRKKSLKVDHFFAEM